MAEFKVDFIGGPNDGESVKLSASPQDGDRHIVGCDQHEAVYVFRFSRSPRAAFVLSELRSKKAVLRCCCCGARIDDGYSHSGMCVACAEPLLNPDSTR